MCVVNRGVNPPCRVFKDYSNMAAEITLKEAHEIKGFIINSYVLPEGGLAHHAGRSYGKIAQRVNSARQVGSPEIESEDP